MDLTKDETKDLKICTQWCIEGLEQDKLQRWLAKKFPRMYSENKERIEIVDRLKSLKKKIKFP